MVPPGWLSVAIGLTVAVQVAGFAVAAASDLSRRIIPDLACAAVLAAGLARRLADGWTPFAISFAFALLLFLGLAFLHARGMVGGGDVKLLTAASAGLPLEGTMQMLAITGLAGGVLAIVHLAMRRLPRPALAPVGASPLRRIYAAERWRILRRGPLPYGIAISVGGIAAVLSGSGI